jgi:hypothetical protein
MSTDTEEPWYSMTENDMEAALAAALARKGSVLELLAAHELVESTECQ